jgi:hypothetical protein
VNAKLVEAVANAVLYEGYMLYPYRPSSVKNRQRWNFGVVYPKAYSEKQNGADNWLMQTECLAKGSSSTELSAKVRFLQAVARTVGELKTPLDEWPVSTESSPEPNFRVVQTLQVGNQVLQTWQEAIEREIILPPLRLAESVSAHRSLVFTFSGGRELEPVCDANGRIAGLIVRTKEPIAAKVDVAVASVDDGFFKITVCISNITATQGPDLSNRDFALMQSLLSAHTILGISGGEFISLVDPPDALKEIISQCNNIGTWPVLAGDERQADGILSSPIILYDYPQIAPESPGDLFDGTEIDEILALRILTLTDEEKYEMRHADRRARQILERTENMPAEHFMKLHGVLRGLRPLDEGKR